MILVIDDSKEDRLLIGEVLRDYEVVFVGRITEALEKIQKYKITLVIIDWLMPVLSGADVLDIIKKHYPHIKCGILTAYDIKKIPAEIKKKADFAIQKNAYETLYREIEECS